MPEEEYEVKVGCFYLREFPAWVREQIAPSQPVVGVFSKDRIISCSPALRAAGLTIGENIERAKVLFPRATFHERDPQLEQTMWEDVLAMLHGATPNILPIKPGWALFRPWDHEALGYFTRSLRATVGIASRRLTAMIAALQGERGDVVVVPDDLSEPFLDAASVHHLIELDFEPELIDRLEDFGLKTFGKLRRLTRRHLHAQFGSLGVTLFELLHPTGDDSSIPLFQPPPTVTVSYSFDPPALEPGEIEPVLKLLIQQGVDGLGGLQAQRLTLRLRGSGPEGLRIGSRVLKAPTAKPYRLYTNANIILRSKLRKDSPVEMLTLELGGLVEPEAIQTNLFFNAPDLYDAVRAIHRRYPGILLRAVITDPHAYIPEEGIRYEPFPDAPPKPQRSKRRKVR